MNDYTINNYKKQRDTMDALRYGMTLHQMTENAIKEAEEFNDMKIYLEHDVESTFDIFNNLYKTPRQKAMSRIRNVIFNDPATIVFWSDGTKTVVKAENESFDPEKGLAMAISKYFFDNKNYYYDVFKEWLPKEEKKVVQKPDELFREVTIKEYCTLKNVTKDKVYGLIKRGEIDARKDKDSGKWMIRILKEEFYI